MEKSYLAEELLFNNIIMLVRRVLFVILFFTNMFFRHHNNTSIEHTLRRNSCTYIIISLGIIKSISLSQYSEFDFTGIFSVLCYAAF